ncbi:Omega-amidase NIT2 [Operophtera brumata]|uniref:omega-amidase n=1 Tax=Operophtera brumata TaxID=104452 RepID=A0A0L7L1W6_OPEBR|nr:Omega-amidase NIT2 [Operophtera brumata]
MIKRALKVALVQLSVGADKPRNIAEAVKEIHKAKQKGAQLVALPECFNSPYGTSPKHWELLGRARANDQQLWVALVSPARDETAGYVAWGHSTLIDPWGQVVSKLDEKAGTLIADIGELLRN